MREILSFYHAIQKSSEELKHEKKYLEKSLYELEEYFVSPFSKFMKNNNISLPDITDERGILKDCVRRLHEIQKQIDDSICVCDEQCYEGIGVNYKEVIEELNKYKNKFGSDYLKEQMCGFQKKFREYKENVLEKYESTMNRCCKKMYHQINGKIITKWNYYYGDEYTQSYLGQESGFVIKRGNDYTVEFKNLNALFIYGVVRDVDTEDAEFWDNIFTNIEIKMRNSFLEKYDEVMVQYLKDHLSKLYQYVREKIYTIEMSSDKNRRVLSGGNHE